MVQLAKFEGNTFSGTQQGQSRDTKSSYRMVHCRKRNYRLNPADFIILTPEPWS